MTRNDKTNQSGESYDLALDGKILLGIVWRSKLTVISFTCAAAILSLLIALMSPNVYRAEAHLKPNHDDAGGGIAGLAAKYGGLASLAGIDLSDGSSDKTALGIAVIKSRLFVTQFIERRDIKVNLMASNGWDEQSGAVVIDRDTYDTASGEWVRQSWFGKGGEPSLQESYEEFMDILQVRQDGETGFITISIDHHSPVVAREWVEWLVSDVNNTVMSQDVTEARQSIDYLQEQMKNTSIVELQSMFSRLIESQLETVMLSEVTDEYLFKTIDPAIEPEKKHRPSRALICILGTLLGAAIGVFVAIIRAFASRPVATS